VGRGGGNEDNGTQRVSLRPYNTNGPLQDRQWSVCAPSHFLELLDVVRGERRWIYAAEIFLRHRPSLPIQNRQRLLVRKLALVANLLRSENTSYTRAAWWCVTTRRREQTARPLSPLPAPTRMHLRVHARTAVSVPSAACPLRDRALFCDDRGAALCVVVASRAAVHPSSRIEDRELGLVGHVVSTILQIARKWNKQNLEIPLPCS
jgi:hypothetical protein